MKTVENYTDYGFGFPVVIDSVEMDEFEGEEVPLINLNELEDRVIRAMPDRTVRLTGNEVRFVRLHFGLTLTAFGKLLCVSHAAVKQWEMKYTEPTGMEWAKEKNLRQFIMQRIGCSDQEVGRLFARLEDERPKETEPLKITMDQWQSYSGGKWEPGQAKKTGAPTSESAVSSVLSSSRRGQETSGYADYSTVPGDYGHSRKAGAKNEYCFANAA